ncbi:uncharacterized protein LOC116410225 isoform X1 [Xenopus tropicalis]|uniref:Uncharacterized protein LOC116410225 isoform X1 n=1 Tax=Xenopus tropicalis TaxID=8364 RepID=A0A8J1JHS8_XENTR|nr:uncharacterized protein LOC116410225 isoform X1 [Xenopus tropicalis]
MGPLIVQEELGTSWAPPKLICFLLIYLSLPGTGSLRIEMGAEPVKSLRNEEAFIPCSVTDWGPGDISPPKLTVKWTQKTFDGREGQVYLYLSGNHTPTRPGSYISTSDLITGNVGLHLPRVQFTDEGEYTCTVIYTPNKAVGHSVLQVSAPPAPRLTPTDITMEPGTEATVTCEADEFYPKDITFQWIKYQRGSGNVPLQKGVSYTLPIDNEDGTFSQSSFLRINPTLEDNGNVYSCNVSHRSMGTDLQLNLTLSVTEPDTPKSQIIIAVVGAAIAVALAALIIYLYIMFWRKEPPKLSPITGAEHLVHMNEATLSCQISEFRPKPIRITLCLQRNGGEVMEIYSWDSEAQTGSAAPVAHPRDEQRVVIAPEREGLMGNGNVQYLPPAQRALRVEMVPVITTSKSRISNCQCTIRITPDIEEDDGAELTVRVTHSALRGPISVSCRLEVRGVNPKISKIVSPLRILQGESLTLTCPIYGFKPKPLSVTWLKVDPLGQETELLCWDKGTSTICDPRYLHELAEYEKQEGEEEDHLNYFLSNVTLKPTVRGDHGAQYVCRTHHYATEHTAEKRMEMQVLALPELDPIQTSSEVLSVGKETTLSCRIHSFHPKLLGVRWYKGDELLASSTDQAHRGDSHLLDCTSRATYRPSVRDIGKSFRCEVSHESLQHPKCVSWELKHLVSKPLISEIECEPEAPECDQPVTLSCTARDFYPATCSVRWYQGRKTISPANDTEPAQQDPESGLFVKTTEMIFTPTINQHGAEYHVEITHSMEMTIRTYHLKLKGFPDIKDITCNTNPPIYGKPLTLSCEVIGCDICDVTAEWRVSGEPIEREMRNTEINQNSVSFILTLTPTAEHCGKVVSCWVKRKDLQHPLKKNYLLKLPDVPPTLSEITAFPKDPPINKVADFTITISGFSERKVEVKWFKSGEPLTEQVVTSEPRVGEDGLYSCNSSVRFPPTGNELIQCEVVTNKGKYTKQFQCKSRRFARLSLEPSTL